MQDVLVNSAVEIQDADLTEKITRTHLTQHLTRIAFTTTIIIALSTPFYRNPSLTYEASPAICDHSFIHSFISLLQQMSQRIRCYI